ncbi:MAG: hypothetical protein NC541_01405 [bacterium]|nr:hypothetical protein [bacterium]
MSKAVMKKRKKRRKKKGGLLWLAVVLLAAAAGGYLYVDSLAYKVCRVEAGVEVKPSDFLKQEDENAYFTPDSDSFSVNEPGEYRIRVKSGWFTHTSTLYIEDTIPPEATLRVLELEYGKTCSAPDFVEEVRDATEVTVTFAELPDISHPGSCPVKLRLTDKGKNSVVLETELHVVPVRTRVVCEVGGTSPGIEAFLIGDVDAQLLTNLAELDLSDVAEYDVILRVDGEEYHSTLQVADTVPPQLVLRDVSGFTLVPRTAEEFVVETKDRTEVTVSFLQEPDLTLTGAQQVSVVARDQGGNETVGQATLTLQADTEPPQLIGVKDITIYLGNTIAYRKNVEVVDNCPEGLNLEIDNSQVNPNAAGSYPVTYRATDYAGNVTEASVTVTILESMYSQETVDALADAVLAKIITDNMTPMEKVQAIFTYIRGHVGYISHSEKGDWLRAAYEGLAEGQGDCYVFASTSKELLTRAGITNMDIEKIPAKTSHYWNLVDVGDGWYHFDTTPRKDHPTIFMWTDEQMMEYSANHSDSHNYDHSAYPEVN